MPGPGRSAIDWFTPLFCRIFANDPIGQVLLLEARHALDDKLTLKKTIEDLWDRRDSLRWEVSGFKADQDESAWILATLDAIDSSKLYEVFTPIISDLAYHRKRVANLAHEITTRSFVQSPYPERLLRQLEVSARIHYTDPLIVLYTFLFLRNIRPKHRQVVAFQDQYQSKWLELDAICTIYHHRWSTNPTAFGCTPSLLTPTDWTLLKEASLAGPVGRPHWAGRASYWLRLLVRLEGLEARLKRENVVKGDGRSADREAEVERRMANLNGEPEMNRRSIDDDGFDRDAVMSKWRDAWNAGMAKSRLTGKSGGGASSDGGAYREMSTRTGIENDPHSHDPPSEANDLFAPDVTLGGSVWEHRFEGTTRLRE